MTGTWEVDTGTSSLNTLIDASTKMETNLQKEIEIEEELFKLRKKHSDELEAKAKTSQQRLMEAMVKQGRIYDEEDKKRQAKDIEKQAALHLQEDLKNEKLLAKKSKDRIKKEADLKLKADLANLEKHYKEDQKYRKKLEDAAKKQAAKEKKDKAQAEYDEKIKAGAELFAKGKTRKERAAALKSMFTDENGAVTKGSAKRGTLALFDSAVNALSDYAKQLEGTIDSIGNKKSIIDTRLQGSKNATKKGSYWEKISSDITGAAAISPYVKQSDIASQVESMVKSGIAYNVEERAFLAAIKDKIAGTFDATSATLTRLVRIQQQDTTAARLGMESALTSFLNNMYETTEYMQGVAESIRGSIEEASALMGATNAVEFEYQVQKWMGSLYSVGMNQTSVTSIANALGQLAAGDISALSGDSGKLLMMAANNSGMSVSEMLANGLDDSDVNTLMNSVVKYLAQIAGETSDSLVVQQQLANVYGLKASDLRAAANLSSSLKNINTNGLSYNNALQQLYSMAGTMGQRTSTGEMLTNVFDNLQYNMAAGIATNPALYGIYKVAGMLDSLTGGIALPDIKVMGTGVNLQTTVADLMRVGAMSGGILSSMGSLISAGKGGGVTGTGLLNAFGVGKGTSVQRGTGGGLITAGGASVSSSGYAGNSSSGDIIGKTTGDANAEGQSQLVSAQEDSEEVTNKTIDDHIVNIYTLLQEVTSGAATFSVKINSSNPLTNLMFNGSAFN